MALKDVNLADVDEKGRVNEDIVDDPFSDMDFMAALDKQINGVTYDDTELDTPKKDQKQTPQAEQAVIEDNTPVQQSAALDKVSELEKKLEAMESRYGSSSTEAQRIKAQLDAVQPYLPIIETMKTDKKLFDMVNTYYETGGQAPVSLIEELNLPEDFVFDGSELADPKSDSSKLFQASISRAVDAGVSQRIEIERKKANQEYVAREKDRERNEFVELYGQDEYDKVIEYSKREPLTLDAMRKLMTLPERDKKITSSAVNEQVNKAQRTAAGNPSLAADGASVQNIPDVEDLIWKNIEKEAGGNNIFGNIEIIR